MKPYGRIGVKVHYGYYDEGFKTRSYINHILSKEIEQESDVIAVWEEYNDAAEEFTYQCDCDYCIGYTIEDYNNNVINSKQNTT